jgi:copper(I)-binding protein
MNAKRLLVTAAILIFSSAVFAHSFKKGDISIDHPWTRATPAGATVGAGYLKITNNGKEADKLTGGTFDGAGTVEIHEMKMTGDNMTMRQLKDGLEIKAGETVDFGPMSFHLMFLGLKNPIAEGSDAKGTLIFEKAGAVDITYKVEPFGATESEDDKH